MIKKLKKFINRQRRVLKVTKKPDAEEFKLITKVSLVGIGLLGFVGYTMYALSQETLLGLPITVGISTLIITYFILQ